MSDFNGRAFLSYSATLTSESLHLFTDASKSGFGGIFGRRYFMGSFPEAWSILDIQCLELYPIFMVLTLHASKLSNAFITLHCDNAPLVSNLNKLTSRNKQVMRFLRPLVLTLLRNAITIRAIHIPGINNVISVKLSRGQVPHHLLREEGLLDTPLRIPAYLLPANCMI